MTTESTLIVVIGLLVIGLLALTLWTFIDMQRSFFKEMLEQLRGNHSELSSLARENHAEEMDAIGKSTHTVRNLHQALLGAPEMLSPHLTDPDDMTTKDPR
jgi:hypothetical protein